MNFIKKRYPQADFSEIGEIDYSNKENEKGKSGLVPKAEDIFDFIIYWFRHSQKLIQREQKLLIKL